MVWHKRVNKIDIKEGRSSSTPVTSDLAKTFHQICLCLHQLVKNQKSTEGSAIYVLGSPQHDVGDWLPLINKPDTIATYSIPTATRQQQLTTPNKLREDKYIQVLQVDEGNATVILNATDYDSKVQALLDDRASYAILKKDPTRASERNLLSLSCAVSVLVQRFRRRSTTDLDLQKARYSRHCSTGS